MSAPTIKKFSLKERPTHDDLNTIYSTFAAKFGNLKGDDFFYPVIFNGDIDLAGNRLLRARELMGILNVEEFGTDEDGFASAINDLSAGGVIWIPRSTTIQLTDSIKLKANRSKVYIIGSGFSSQIFMANGSDDDAIVIEGANQFHLSNFYINGNSANNSSGGGIVVRNSKDFVIDKVWVGNGSTTGVTDSSISCTNCSDFKIERCWLRNPKKNGIVLDEGSRGFTVSQVLVDMTNGNTTFGQHGILVQNQTRDGAIHSNTLRNLGYGGVFVGDADNVAVTYNQIHGNGNNTGRIANHAGVTVRGTSASVKSTGVAVTGNRCTGAQIGVSVGSHVKDCNVTGNYVRDNTQPIEYTGAGTSRVNFRGNMALEMSNNGRVTFKANKSVTKIDIGVTQLPIQAIHATWDVFPPSLVKNSVLGARYKGQTIFFYNSSKLAGGNFSAWYTIEI